MIDHNDVLNIYEGNQLQLLLKVRDCKAKTREALKLAKSGHKDLAGQKMEEAEELLAQATELPAELFSQEEGADISLRTSFVLDSLADCQSILELSREVVELY